MIQNHEVSVLGKPLGIDGAAAVDGMNRRSSRQRDRNSVGDGPRIEPRMAVAPEGLRQRALGRPVQDAFPWADSARGVRRLAGRLLRKSLEQTLEALRLLREARDLDLVGSRRRPLLREQRLPVVAQRSQVTELAALREKGMIHLLLQLFFESEISIQPLVRGPIGGEQRPIPSCQGVQPAYALEKTGHVPGLEHHPKVAVASEA